MKSPVEIALEQIILPFPELHEFQVEDINKLALLKYSALWWEIGLGKTVASAIIGCYKLIEEDYDVVYTLCPATLVVQWSDVLEKMGVSVTSYVGTPTNRKKLNRDVNFLVMSYQIFQKDYDTLKSAKMFFIIDEAVVMCNTGNVIRKMVQGGGITKKKKVPGKIMPKITKRRFDKINRGCVLLSATPISKPEDSYGLIDILTPDVYRNYSQFLRIHVSEEDYFGNPVSYSDLDLLKENLLLAAVQRLTTDHIKLPPIIFKTIKYDLHPSHLKLYNKLLDEKFLEKEGEILVDALSAGALYNWSQKLVLNPDEGGYEKTPEGFELMDGLVEHSKSFLIFNNYRMTNSKVMDRYDIGAAYGGVTAKQRDKFIKDFKSGDMRGLAVHPKSAGVGLDLPNCRYVLFSELPITPRDFFQAVGRAYRQGQKGTVVVVVLVARRTIQESLFRNIQAKGDLMAEVINTSRSLSEDLNENVVVTSKKTRSQIFKELRGGE